MSKAIIVVDFAYKGPVRRGRGTAHQGLMSTLKYLQFRDTRDHHIPQTPENERWKDHGMGHNYRTIFNNCDTQMSDHVLAWLWVVSPAPDLMALVPEQHRAKLVCDLTERIVEDYYLARGFDLSPYSYVVHDRPTAGEGLQHLHTHVVLPGTVPTISGREPIYNNKERKHDRLFREIATEHFADLLDQHIGHEWRYHREQPRDFGLER